MGFLSKLFGGGGGGGGGSSQKKGGSRQNQLRDQVNVLRSGATGSTGHQWSDRKPWAGYVPTLLPEEHVRANKVAPMPKVKLPRPVAPPHKGHASHMGHSSIAYIDADTLGTRLSPPPTAKVRSKDRVRSKPLRSQTQRPGEYQPSAYGTAHYSGNSKSKTTSSVRKPTEVDSYASFSERMESRNKQTTSRNNNGFDKYRPNPVFATKPSATSGPSSSSKPPLRHKGALKPKGGEYTISSSSNGAYSSAYSSGSKSGAAAGMDTSDLSEFLQGVPAPPPKPTRGPTGKRSGGQYQVSSSNGGYSSTYGGASASKPGHKRGHSSPPPTLPPKVKNSSRPRSATTFSGMGIPVPPPEKAKSSHVPSWMQGTKSSSLKTASKTPASRISKTISHKPSTDSVASFGCVGAMGVSERGAKPPVAKYYNHRNAGMPDPKIFSKGYKYT